MRQRQSVSNKEYFINVKSSNDISNENIFGTDR